MKPSGRFLAKVTGKSYGNILLRRQQYRICDDREKSLDIARNIKFNCNGRIGCTCYKEIPIKNIDDTESKFFMRMQVEDRPGVLASVASVLGNTDVGIDRVIQKTKKNGVAELVVITDSVLEKNFKDALSIFNGMAMIKEISSLIRVY